MLFLDSSWHKIKNFLPPSFPASVKVPTDSVQDLWHCSSSDLSSWYVSWIQSGVSAVPSVSSSVYLFLDCWEELVHCLGVAKFSSQVAQACFGIGPGLCKKVAQELLDA